MVCLFVFSEKGKTIDSTENELMLAKYIRFFLENKLVVWLLLGLFLGWGLMTAPFDFGIKGLPRDPVAVDAIPNIGENQQIVFTQWMGRSPQDVEEIRNPYFGDRMLKCSSVQETIDKNFRNLPPSSSKGGARSQHNH